MNFYSQTSTLGAMESWKKYQLNAKTNIKALPHENNFNLDFKGTLMHVTTSQVVFLSDVMNIFRFFGYSFITTIVYITRWYLETPKCKLLCVIGFL